MDKEGLAGMDTFLFVLVVLFLLIAAGVAISIRLYTLGALGTGRFRRIRRVRTLPDGPIIEEIIEEEAPAENEI